MKAGINCSNCNTLVTIENGEFEYVIFSAKKETKDSLTVTYRLMNYRVEFGYGAAKYTKTFLSIEELKDYCC